MNDEKEKDSMRNVLKKLVRRSNANFSADDVLRQFRHSNSSQKLLQILDILCRNHPDALEYLQEAERNFEDKEPLYCLFKFLSHFNDPIMQTLKKKDLSTSTPLITKKKFDPNSIEVVTDIKGRVVQAVTSAGQNRILFGSSAIRDILPTLITPPTTTTPTAIAIATTPTATARSSSSTTTINSNTSLSPSRTSIHSVADKKECIDTSLWDFYILDYFDAPLINTMAIPITSQENILLYDLLYCLTGMRGSFITPDKSATSQPPPPNDATNGTTTPVELKNGYNMKFAISEQIHSSLRDIAREILPLASYYRCIQKFIQMATFYNCGQVLQALAQALHTLINDYYLLLAQLECELNAGHLTLHKMLFYIRPTLNTMSVLANVVTGIIKDELRGGRALTLLYEKINSLTGDDESQKFLIQLTRKAAIPYMDILQLWIHKGLIKDPQLEFLVEDNEMIQREELPEHYSADYWEKRYTIRRDRIPCFLEKVSDLILRTGKYLNVIRQCGQKVKLQQPGPLDFTPTSQNHITAIQDAYHYASKNLLEVLLNENDLMGHLMSVKRYLLLNQGDFIAQFMDACEEEFSKNVDSVLPMKLENLLGLTLRLSSAKQDPYKDDLHCELLTYDLVTQMCKIMSNEEEVWQSNERLDLNGLECFAFRYEVKWPVSLVLNHIAISKYQMLFRQLFFCKHVERQLCKIWKENSVAKKFSPHAAQQYRSAFTLRQRMMNAVQNLEYYMMVEVIEPNWHTFIENMNKIGNVDEVLVYHQDFLDSCLKNCMLTDTTTLNRSIFQLCNVCLKFCEFIQHESAMAPTETFAERVKRFDLEFTALLIGLLKQINDVASDNPSERFINLVHRINFNSFYNEHMEKICIKSKSAD